MCIDPINLYKPNFDRGKLKSETLVKEESLMELLYNNFQRNLRNLTVIIV
jgi:hypothetical protein